MKFGDGQTFKLRASTDNAVAFSFGSKLANYGTYTIGIEWRDIGKANSIKFGQ